MAKKWFTPYPDVYFMKTLRKGGRNEFLFTFLGKILTLGLFLLERCIFSQKVNQIYNNRIEYQTDYSDVKTATGDLLKLNYWPL